MTEQTTAVAADGTQDQPELPDLGITCQHPPAGSCTAPFPFDPRDTFRDRRYSALAAMWTCESGVWQCPEHAAYKPWWAPWDREQRVTDDEAAAWPWDEYRQPVPEPMIDLYDDGLPVSQPGTEDEWDAAALAAGNDQPDPAGRDEVRDRNGVTFWADEMPDTDGEPTGFLTKIFPRIGGRR